MMGRLNCEVVFLLVASVIIGCLSDHHEPNESGTEYHGDIGFLLYLPANLESGATVQAYIETNTTEPFTAELNFIHSNEDRHFYSSARIENGEGSIDIEVPKVDYWYGSVNFTGVFEVSQKTITGSRNNIYIYRDVQKATFIETDKPLYKPGQEVKFRLITIDSDFKPETSNISKIQIESPNNIRLAQWRNVERPDGLVDLSFQLISEPALGIYNIKAYVDDNWISQPFKVDEYVLPKFEVTVRADSYILINAEEFSFQVCAKYTYGQPVRGSLAGSVGKVVKENYYYYYRQRESTQLGEEQDELELTDAVEFIAELDNQGCCETTIDVTEMNLSSYDTPYWKTSLAVKATITEASTGNEFTETYAGTKLETTALHINMESASTFKPGIPYQGRIKVTYPDDKPAPNEVLNITARVDGETVHQDEATTDSDGIVNFEIPFAVMDKSIRLTVTAVGYPSEHSEDSYSMYQPSSYINLDPAYSNIGSYMQILPVTETVNAGEDVTVQVLYTSDDSTVSSDFKFQFVARNKLIDAGATHIGESRRRRVAILDETECQQQLREATEKGALGSFRPDCDENGLFMKRQCHASTRRCWCVNPETGLEVTSGVTPDCEAEEESGPIEVPIGELGPPDAFNECQEGFSFAPGVKKCVRTAEETECQRQAREAQEKGPLVGGRQPACHEDGSFLPEQCHGSTGYCWCVDTATGLEVPGTSTGPTEENVDCEAEGESGPIEVPIGELGPPDAFNECQEGFSFAPGVKKCVRTAEETECQRQAREAQEKGPLLGGRQPACHEDGSFLPEQCHGSIGNCWCVDTATGLEVPETRTGPTEENVDCEEPVEVLTECQRQVQEAQGKGPLVGGHQPACHEDGSFLPEQCHGSTGYCWCVDTATGLEVPGTSTGPSEKNVDCEEFTLTLTLPPPTTQEPIVHVDPQALQEATFLVRITPGLSPEARLLVYYTSPEGEIIADSVTIKVNEAFENEVHLEFSEPEVEPGSETTLKVSAENGSLCGIGIVDKSVYVLGGENKLTPKKLFAVFDLSVRTAYYGDYCSHGYYRYRFKRYILPYPGYGYNTVTYTDSSEAFKNSGLMTVTNFDLEVAPCTYSPAIAYSIARSGGEEVFDSPEGNGGAAKQDGEDTIRSYFPSTWLWTLQRVSETPAEMQLPVPDTITDWIANGFCTNVKYGVGIAPPVTLRAFQPFFLSMSLPYSIIRTEKTPIKVSVFNYLEQCLVVRVTLEENEDVVLSGDSMYTVAVPAGDVTTVTFKVAAFVLGEIPLQVTAESISDDEFLCGNEAVAGAAGTSDTVLRNLKVKPEGEPETRTESVYFCLENNETYNKHVSLKIPPQHVPGTAVGEITVTGDLVGNSLSNVEDMLRMPYGCGEQNLLSMVPNIVALQYLQSVGEATPEITEEAKKNILSGYQRELIYRRTDNSYSAFGNSNPSGSTFLTAFVVRTYAHAQKFVEVDEEDLFVTIQWLRGIQEVDGSFRTVGYLAHKAMKGGVNNNVTLAAYVVSTFLEAGYGTEDKTVAAAFKYLNSQLDSLEDTYSMALLAYAYALAGMEEFDQVYEKLQESAINSEGTRHWESNREGLPSYTSYYQDSAKSQNIEMTAYVLRAMILYDIPDIEVEGSYIARWLVAQRNPRGGFSSTQDTVIGLTALAEFSSMGSGSPEITLTMNIRGGETLEYEVTTDNRYVLQQGFFEDFPAEISVSAAGTGCALYTVSGDYYIKKEKQLLDPFSISIKTKGKRPLSRKRRDTSEESEEEEETEEAAPCDKFTISISARYNGEDGASNMAIVNVRPVSGFVFDKDSLESLKRKYDFVRRYEINEDTITFYFDEITNDDMEFEFDVIKEFDVEDAKPAFITILDYYENGLKVAEEFEFVCIDEEATESPSTTYTTPVSPSGFPSSSSTETPDFDECLTPDVCGGPEYVCINYPGTYECICADGYALDETEENCVAIPSCPVCAMDLPVGSEESVCSSDFIKVMKVRGDGTLRPLTDLLNNVEIRDRSYIDIDIDENCPCDLLSGGGRIIVIANNDHISPSFGKNAEKILLDESVFVVESISSVKKDIGKVLIDC